MTRTLPLNTLPENKAEYSLGSNLIRMFFLLLITVFLAACGGGGGSSDPAPNKTVSGVVQLGFINGGKVSIYKLEGLTTPLATTNTSDLQTVESAGKFSFEDLQLVNDTMYLLKVTGGNDVDVNDDGIIDTTTQIELKGTVHALALGSQLKSGVVRVTALSDMAYQKVKAILDSSNAADITALLDAHAKENVYDINGDAVVDNSDILEFNPVNHQHKSKNNYNDILNIYVPNLHLENSEDKKLASLLYLDKPRVIVENGNLQEVPFTLKASLVNAPKGVVVTWSLDGVNKSSINESIVKDGIYSVVAELSKNGVSIKTSSAQVIATTKLEIASIDVDVTTDNTVFVTDESGSSLAGTQIYIPQGAFAENTKITIKKSSINTIPGSDGLGITDVIVMEPSGLVFDRPVQVRIPYNPIEDLSNQTVRIARYSDGGSIDYLTPLFIDTDTHEIVFETDHFSSFGAKKAWVYGRKSADELFIEKLNEEFADHARTMEDWEPILNSYIDGSLKKLTVYDYINTYFENKKIYETINPGPEITKDGFLYVEALNSLYKDSAEADSAYQRWAEIKDSFSVMSAIIRAGSTGLSLLNGKVYMALLDSMNIPTSASSLELYNPVGVGELIVKAGVNARNNIHIQELFNLAVINREGVFEYKTPVLTMTRDFLNESNIRYKSETIVRRYRAYEADPNGEHELVKQVINDVIALRDNNYQSIDIDYCHAYSKNPKLLIGDVVTIDVSCNIVATSDYQMEFKLYEDYYSYFPSRVDIIKTELISDGKYRVSFAAQKLGTNEYYLDGVAKLMNSSLMDSYLSGGVRINVKEDKEIVTILQPTVTGSIDSLGNYNGHVVANFDNGIGLEHSIETSFKYDRSSGKYFTITKADYENPGNDNYLNNFYIAVLPTHEMKVRYEITGGTGFTVNLKPKIDRELDEIEFDTTPSLKILSVNGVSISSEQQNDSVTLNEGESVTFAIPRENIQAIISKRFETLHNSNHMASGGYVDGDYIYEYTYTHSGEFLPNIKLTLTSGRTVTISAAKVIVNKLDNNYPSIDIAPDETIYNAGNKVYLNATIADSDGTVSALWEKIFLYDEIEIINKNSSSAAYFIAPAITSDKIYGFKVTATDDDGAVVSQQHKVHVQGDNAFKSELTFLKDINYADECVSYSSSDCGALISSGITTLTKQWQFRNSGNLALKNLQLLQIPDSHQGAIKIKSMTVASFVEPGEVFEISADIELPTSVLDGQYSARWQIRDEFGKIILLPNGKSAGMFFKFNIDRETTESKVADRFDYPIGNRGYGQNSQITHFPEQIAPEKNIFFTFSEEVTNSHTRTASSANALVWRNAQDVGSYLASQGGVHPGEDWNLGAANDDAGEQVYAVANGQVLMVRSTFNGGYKLGGWTVVLKHRREDVGYVYSIYSHLTSSASTNGSLVVTREEMGLQPGDIVERGEIIGRLAHGNQLNAFNSAHLHFEMRTTEPSTDLWPYDNGLGYYSHDGAIYSDGMTAEQIKSTFSAMDQHGIFDPSDYIDKNRMSSTALLNMQVTSISYSGGNPGDTITIVINGTGLPSSLAMSLSGASCGSPYDVTSTQAKIDCVVPNALGMTPFYIAAFPKGPSITGEVDYMVDAGKASEILQFSGTSGDSLVRLNWQTVTGANSYNLYYAQEPFDSLGDISNYTTLAGGTMVKNVTSPVDITDLANATTYYFLVEALSSGGTRIVSETTPGITPTGLATADVINIFNSGGIGFIDADHDSECHYNADTQEIECVETTEYRYGLMSLASDGTTLLNTEYEWNHSSNSWVVDLDSEPNLYLTSIGWEFYFEEDMTIRQRADGSVLFNQSGLYDEIISSSVTDVSNQPQLNYLDENMEGSVTGDFTSGANAYLWTFTSLSDVYKLEFWQDEDSDNPGFCPYNSMIPIISASSNCSHVWVGNGPAKTIDEIIDGSAQELAVQFEHNLNVRYERVNNDDGHGIAWIGENNHNGFSPQLEIETTWSRYMRNGVEILGVKITSEMISRYQIKEGASERIFSVQDGYVRSGYFYRNGTVREENNYSFNPQAMTDFLNGFTPLPPRSWVDDGGPSQPAIGSISLLEYEMEMFDLETEIITQMDFDFPEEWVMGDFKVAYNADTTIHSRISFPEGGYFSFIDERSFSDVSADDVSSNMFIFSEGLDKPFENSDTIVIYTDEGNYFKIGNAVENEHGLSFDYQQMTPQIDPPGVDPEPSSPVFSPSFIYPGQVTDIKVSGSNLPFESLSAQIGNHPFCTKKLGASDSKVVFSCSPNQNGATGTLRLYLKDTTTGSILPGTEDFYITVNSGAPVDQNAAVVNSIEVPSNAKVGESGVYIVRGENLPWSTLELELEDSGYCDRIEDWNGDYHFGCTPLTSGNKQLRVYEFDGGALIQDSISIGFKVTVHN